MQDLRAGEVGDGRSRMEGSSECRDGLKMATREGKMLVKPQSRVLPISISLGQ